MERAPVEEQEDESGAAASDRASAMGKRLRRLATDADPDLRSRAVDHLSWLLAGLSGLERTGLVADWATSGSPLVRVAIAHALRHAPPTIGDWSAIEHLARDLEPAVRGAIVGAAWQRREEAADRLGAVLYRLSADPEPSVRLAASLTLEA